MLQGGFGTGVRHLEEARRRGPAARRLGIEGGGCERPPKDSAGVQAYLIGLDERASAALGRVAEDDDAALKVGAALQELVPNPEARLQAVRLALPGLARRQQPGMDEIVALGHIFHLGGLDKLPVTLRNTFPPVQPV